MANKHEFRTLHALTEQQLEDLISFFVTRGWKTLGSSRLLRPDELHRLPRLEQVVYRDWNRSSTARNWPASLNSKPTLRAMPQLPREKPARSRR